MDQWESRLLFFLIRMGWGKTLDPDGNLADQDREQKFTGRIWLMHHHADWDHSITLIFNQFLLPFSFKSI